MAGEAAFGTNNPFRRKAAASASAPDPAVSTSTFPASSFAADPTDAVSSVFADNNILQPEPQQPRPSIDHFQKHLQSLPQSATPPPLTTFAKPKPVKKVRVQSPPPSSPESISAIPEFPAPGEAGGYDSDTSSSSDDDDSSPETAGRSGISGAWPESVREGSMRAVAQAPPQNPFQRTLEDMESTSRETASSPSIGAVGKGGMDVSSFGRLLLTGQAEMRSPASQSSQQQPPPPPLPAIPGDSASVTDASSVSRQSIFDATYATPETPRTSHEISESGDDDLPSHSTPKPRLQSTPATLRKKPPPPDSRHGKLIKIELKDNEKKPYTTEVERRPGSASSSSTPSKQATPTTPSDVNKPLPPAPSRNAADDDENDSVFDREAAGKVPEIVQEPDEMVLAPRPPTPPNASHSATPKSATGSKKPPPPPRRNTHGRSDTRPLSSSSNNSALPPTPQQPHNDADHHPPRSSLDSTRSRSSSIRVNINAPTPPPPRRPTHARGMSQTFASPSSAVSFTSNLASSASSPSAVSDAERAPFGSLASPDVAEAGARSPEATGSGSAAAARQPEPTISVPASASAGTLSAGPPPTLHPHLSSSSSQSKLSPPPPPPARNSSVRAAAHHSASAVSPGGAGRPPSVSSLDAVSRRLNATKENVPGSSPAMAPPPPPPRQRGNSRSSLEAPGGGAVPRRPSVDSVRVLGGNVAEEPGEDMEMNVDTSAAEAADILADLDALKREVDAARAGAGG